MQALALPLSAVAALLLVTLNALPAQAQAWLASFGSDANPCTRANPCATLQRAYDVTLPGGEIRCVDAANVVGGVTIMKSITIDCEDNIASVPFGFSINVAASDVVTLKGLDIHAISTSVGVYLFAGAGLLQLDKVTIRNPGGSGLIFIPDGPAKLVMSDCVVSDNPIYNILIKPTNGAAVQAIFDRVTVAGAVFGIKADGSGQASGQIDVDVRDSVVAHNVNNGFIAVSDAGQAPIHYKITRSTGFNNGAFGAVATGAQAFMIVSGSSLTKNGTGLGQLDSSTVATYTNNDVNFNTVNVSGTITAIPQR